MYQRYMLSFYNIYRLSLGAISKCTGLILLHVLIETFLDQEFFFQRARGLYIKFVGVGVQVWLTKFPKNELNIVLQ